MSSGIFFAILFLLGTISGIPESNFISTTGGRELPIYDDGAEAVQLTRPFRFFNQEYKTVYVGSNGILSFSKPVVTFTPDCTGLHGQSKVIAPFWADVDIRRGGRIVYRESADPSILDKVNRQLLIAFPSYGVLRMAWAFTTTWDKVAFFDRGYTGNVGLGRCPNDDARNTFQVTLATDGTMSFAIFYYDEIKWTTGTASGGNCSGLNGHPAKAGFDEGSRGTFIHIGGSCNYTVLDINKNQNVGMVPGVYVYRVDNVLELPPAIGVADIPCSPNAPQATPSSPVRPTATVSAPIAEENRACPNKITKASTPCRESLVNIIEHVMDFVRDFPTVCWGEFCPGYYPPCIQPATQAPITTEVPTPSQATPDTHATTIAPAQTDTADAPVVTQAPIITQPPPIVTQVPNITDASAASEAPTTTQAPTTPSKAPIVTQAPNSTKVPSSTQASVDNTSKPTNESSTPVACSRDNDLAIILDSSGSIGIKNYELAKDFIAKLSKSFSKHPRNRLTLVYYATDAFLYIPLDNKMSPDEMEEKVHALPYLAGLTYTAKGIKIGVEQLKAHKRGVPQSLIVLTDGVSNDDAAGAAGEAISGGVQTFAIGIGAGVNEQELKKITGQRQDRVSVVTNFQSLEGILNKVSRELCP